MIRKVLLTAGMALMASLPASQSFAGWSKSFVFDYFEPAMYYGAKEGVANPGSDCPLGTMPEPDWKKMLKTAWRTDAEVAKIMDPEGPSRQRDGGFRGPSPDISIYAQPWTLPDPGVFEVVGDTSYGFNLDGDEKTGFTSPDGKIKGVDNEYYRAIGCLSTWRGPSREGHHAKYVMDGMRDGSFTVVMIVSGEGADPANDANAKVGFYTAMDKMVKDANGNVAHDYTFRINPAGLQSVVDAKTTNGVIETRGPAFINVRSVDNVPMKIENGQLRFEIKPDGSIEGVVGGYRSVNEMYNELAGGGATFELTMRMTTPAVWYALQRRADWKPNAGGKNSFISMAYRFYGKPAFVMTPDAQKQISVAELMPIPAGFVPPAAGRAPRAAE